jgi:hypothetical protein
MIDGDYTTWTCIRRNQQNGDAYTVRLRKATPIHDVRICMGTENGDYMTAGLVQISTNGSTWESIPISGTTDTNYTLENEHNVKYNDEMTYCDFDGQGKTARYVRLYLSTPKTSNWLRLYEIEVNGRLFEAAHQGLALDEDSVTIPELADAEGATYFATTNKPGEIIWHFRSLQYIKALSIYRDGGKATDATVCITTDGEEWIELGSLTGYVSHYDITAYPLAVAAKISWTSKAPLIYEIAEETDEGTNAITGIRSVDFSEAPEHQLEHKNEQQAIYNLSGQRLSIPQKGINIIRHRKTLVK